MMKYLTAMLFLVGVSGSTAADESLNALPGSMSAAEYFVTVSKIAGLCESTAYLAEFRKDDQSKEIEEFRFGFFDYIAERKGLDRQGLIKACSKAVKEWKAISKKIAPQEQP